MIGEGAGEGERGFDGIKPTRSAVAAAPVDERSAEADLVRPRPEGVRVEGGDDIGIGNAGLKDHRRAIDRLGRL